MTGRWVDLREAARLLGASTEAVRKRAASGALRSERQAGRVLVWVDGGRTEDGGEAQADGGALVEELHEQVHYLRTILNEEREARRQAETIIAQLTKANAALAASVPELKAAESREEPSQAPVEGGGVRVGYPPGDTGGSGDSERPRDTAEFPAGGSLTRPWWRRVLGG